MKPGRKSVQLCVISGIEGHKLMVLVPTFKQFFQLRLNVSVGLGNRPSLYEEVVQDASRVIAANFLAQLL